MKRNLIMTCTAFWFAVTVCAGQSAQDQTQSETSAADSEAGELFQEVRDKLESKYRQALREYVALRSRRQTVKVDTAGLTLHQVKVYELDQTLNSLTAQLEKQRAAQRWVEEAARQGLEDVEVIVWILQQEGAIKAEGDLPPEEMLQRYKVSIDHKVEQLEKAYAAKRDEYKHYYEKAVEVEQAEDHLRRKEQEIERLRKWLDQLPLRAADQTIEQRLESLENRLKSLEEKIEKLLDKLK